MIIAKRKTNFECEINQLKKSVIDEKKFSENLKIKIENGVNFFTDAESIYLKTSV